MLRFGFVNLAPSTDDPARLVRTRPGADIDAFVVVAFPPQHVQERAFDESAAGKEPLVPAPIPAAAAYPSRLAFRLPAEQTELPLTLEALLDWDTWEPSVAANALPPAPTAEQLAGRPQPAAPAVTETAIELPYRLVLSPLAGARWVHRTDAAGIDGRVELWHTRLAGAAADGTVSPDGALQPVRAIWSPDLDASSLWLRRSALGDALQSLDEGQRRQIVRLSSNFAIPVRGGTYGPEPARTRRLLLSALGGWLDVHGRWPVPDTVRLPDDLSPYITPQRAIDPDHLRVLVDRSHVERLVELDRAARTGGRARRLVRARVRRRRAAGHRARPPDQRLRHAAGVARRGRVDPPRPAGGTVRRGRRPARVRRRSGMAGRPTVHVGPRAAQHEAPARHVHGDGDVTLPRVLPAGARRRARRARRASRRRSSSTCRARRHRRRPTSAMPFRCSAGSGARMAGRGPPRAAVAGCACTSGGRGWRRARASCSVPCCGRRRPRRARHLATSSDSSPRGGSIRCGRPRSRRRHRRR